MAEPDISQAGARTLRRSTMLCWVALLACGSPCDDNDVVRSGVRFRVTVLEDATLCGDAIVFAPQDEFVVIAGETVTSGQGCDYTAAQGAPELPQSRFEIHGCRPDLSVLATQCSATLDDCASGTMRFIPLDVPTGSGPMQSEFIMDFDAGTGGCIPSCLARFPITIQRI